MFQIILVVVMLYLGLNLNFGRFIFLQVRVACFAHFIGVTFSSKERASIWGAKIDSLEPSS